MAKGFSFTYWIGKVASLLVLMAPLLMSILPAGWENITLGIAAHFVIDWANQTYHAA